MTLFLGSNFDALWVGKIQTLDFPFSSNSPESSSQYLGPARLWWIGIWVRKFRIPAALMLLLGSNFDAFWVDKIQSLDFPISSNSSDSSSQHLGPRSGAMDQYLVQKIPDSCSYVVVLGFEFGCIVGWKNPDVGFSYFIEFV